jgi:hypothetical protein
MKPLAIDLFCGLGGWTSGLLAEGYNVVGFDIERHVYGEHAYPAQLVIQDVLTLHGSQFRHADLIVASPPCQEYSWMAMPWSRAKAVARALRGEGEFPEGYRGSRTIPELTALFNACFRIQREASAAAGRHIPMVVENVRGAQPWVGRARWSYGSFYLWGDVPALMPMTFKAQKNPGFRFDGSGRSFQSESVDRHTKNTGGSWFNIAHNTTSGKGQNPDGRKFKGDWFRDPDCPTRQGGQKGRKYDVPAHDGVKQPGINLSEIGFNVANAHEFGHMVEGVKIKRSADDKRQHIGTKCKFASAMIAKIPLALSRHIAATYSLSQRSDGQ